MAVRGIRGAVTIDADQAEKVKEATRELLSSIQKENSLHPEDIASVLFTATPDIRSAFPAAAARAMGWNGVPLLCFQEIEVAGALPLCIRVLIHLNSDKPQDEIKHVYLKGARQLRPDLNPES